VNLAGEFSRKHPVFPVSLCKKYNEGDPERFPGRSELPPPQPQIVDGVPVWEVDRILNERIRETHKGHLREYHVRWKGYSSTYDKWVPERDLKDATRVLETATRELSPFMNDSSFLRVVECEPARSKPSTGPLYRSIDPMSLFTKPEASVIIIHYSDRNSSESRADSNLVSFASKGSLVAPEVLFYVL
jgi:Chromo (CHRromatin Organisation MOdifier) domain